MMKMRELEQRSGVRREMIRFYFRNGLLPDPTRPKPNVAFYGDEHVRSLLAIRRLQTEQRLSIDEIKRAVNGKSTGAPSDATTFRHLDELVAARLGADQTLVPLDSIKERNPKAETDAKALHKAGAIKLVSTKGQRCLSRMDAQIVAIWGDMRAAGYREDTGFDASVTELYVGRAKDLAKAEIAAFLARTPDYEPERKAEFAQIGLTHMMNLFSLLRMKAVLDEFRKSGL